MKARTGATRVRFYDPDAEDAYLDRPALVIEILSQSTRRTDEGEKREAYCAIPCLKGYLMLEQDSPTVVAFLRGEQGFVREVFHGLSAVVRVPDLDLELGLADVYDRVSFGPEVED